MPGETTARLTTLSNKALAYIATVFCFLGMTLVATGHGVLGWTLRLLGDLFWIWWSLAVRPDGFWAILSGETVFTIIDLLGARLAFHKEYFGG